jgi:hypothetical protein
MVMDHNLSPKARAPLPLSAAAARSAQPHGRSSAPLFSGCALRGPTLRALANFEFEFWRDSYVAETELRDAVLTEDPAITQMELNRLIPPTQAARVTRVPLNPRRLVRPSPPPWGPHAARPVKAGCHCCPRMASSGGAGSGVST